MTIRKRIRVSAAELPARVKATPQTMGPWSEHDPVKIQPLVFLV